MRRVEAPYDLRLSQLPARPRDLRRRWGVVALTAVAATMRLMVFAALTLESGEPYSPIAFTVCAALAFAAFAAFRGALAGKPMFGSAAFEDQPAA